VKGIKTTACPCCDMHSLILAASSIQSIVY
jgi:hypothetical protein